MKFTSAIVALSLIFGVAGSFMACSLPASAEMQEKPRIVEVMVHGAFVPDKIAATEGEHVRLDFIRHDSGECTKFVVFPSLGIRKELPTGQKVSIDLPSLKAGDLNFECGMGMIKGTIAVASKR